MHDSAVAGWHQVNHLAYGCGILITGHDASAEGIQQPLQFKIIGALEADGVVRALTGGQ